MRRLIAGLTGVLVIGSVTAIVLGPSASSLAGAGAGAGASAAPTIDVTLSPQSGQQAVGNDPNEYVQFGGRITPGDAIVRSAYIRFEGANGERCKTFTTKKEDLNVWSTLKVDSSTGQISGTQGMPGMGNDVNSPTCHGGRLILRVTAEDKTDGLQTTAFSQPVPIDLAGPQITQARLTAPTKVSVLFSEPVFLPSQPDSVVDWEVDRFRPISISGTSTEKILTLAPTQAKDQDATPEVFYKAGAGLVPGREFYQDESAHNAYAGGGIQIARDMIPPVIPDIVDVAGKTGSSVAASDATPEVRITNLREGHWAELYLEANGNDTLDRPGDAFLGEDQADASGAQIEVPELQADKTYKFYAIARDNARCQPGDENSDELCPNWSGADAGSTVSYVLDRVAPAPVFASLTGVGEVTVGLTEAVSGSNTPGNWSISGATVTAVSGTGNRRQLTAPGAAPGATVTYSPGNYADAAGNTLAGFSTTLLDALPPIVSITDPPNEQYVQASTYTIKGTAHQADHVEIFRDTNGNETLDSGEPSLGTVAVSGNSWSVQVPLSPDVTNEFFARGSRTDSTPQVQGSLVGVPDLIQDSIDPTLSLDPVGGPFRGGQDEPQVVISWSASDANFEEPPGPITIEYSKDGGAEWMIPDDRAVFHTNQDPNYEWKPPFDNTTNALIRVTATDRSGRRATKTSSPFEIDSIIPVFIPTLVDERNINLTFSEPVDGAFLAQEWEIDGEPAGQITPTGPASGVTSARLTLSPLAPDLDLMAPHTVAYDPRTAGSPLSQDAEIRDHVGNTVVPRSSLSPVTQPTQPPVDPDGSPIPCTIMGTDGADTLIGTDGPDVICPLGGTDTVEALGGDDIVVTGPGSKTIYGGAGDDQISGGDGFDTLSGGPGNDFILGYGGDDQLAGDDGNDVLHGDEGNDTLSGGRGVDLLEGEGGDDHLSGDAGIDHLAGSNGNDTLLGGDDNDRLLGHAGDDQLRGGNGDDFLEGGDGVDVLRGENGNDVLSGSAGKDHLFGDAGNDHLEGGDDNDRVDGGTGNDVVNGGNGDDTILGGTGNDRGNGGAGDDRIDGDSGRDVLIGGDGRDRITGGSGKDELKGSDDNDSLSGGRGRDVISGENGRDRLYGDEHGDRLLGGRQRDKLDGGTGRDFCNGGPSRDAKLGCERGPRR